ncbi:MAG: hypothetical protein DWQ47_11645 [Acidobacteria bacterium]|nr:MAG: hypothetical protein DWQ32_14060 [Acidobacteriota bacterium]REJ98229.1 MAG: hypothetical protein DWQ38_16860 [Acidobacteriota bacterium]REK16973.1 MAG: hypothetical protein DWQ43_01905 [Acidobacteriota bacterium]REK42883.1 MAG: hypothetical protein DWQ47_11645 [Acidobacteriota bacterium]
MNFEELRRATVIGLLLFLSGFAVSTHAQITPQSTPIPVGVVHKDVVARFPTPVSDGQNGITPVGYCGFKRNAKIFLQGFVELKDRKISVHHVPLFYIAFFEKAGDFSTEVLRVTYSSDHARGVECVPHTYAYVLFNYDLGVDRNFWSKDEASYCKLNVTCNQEEWQRRNKRRGEINSDLAGSKVTVYAY